jgi:hypothetical protein
LIVLSRDLADKIGRKNVPGMLLFALIFVAFIFANLLDFGDYVSFRAVLGFTNPKPILLRSPKPVSRPNSITRLCTVSIEPHINSQMLADTP